MFLKGGSMEFSIRNRKVWFISLLLCIALFLLSGCEMKKMGGDAASKESYVVTDAFDNQVTIPHKPKKILGTDSAIDTMLLGVVEPSRLAACFIADKDPGMSYIADEVKDIKPEIPLNGISMEILTKISPDLIVASSYTRQKELDMWRSLGYPVVMIDGPTSIAQAEKDIRIIAAAVGEAERGEKVVTEMERQLKEVDSTLAARSLPPQTGLLVSQMSRYGGPGSMYHELLTRAGIKNAIAEVGVANGQLLSQELIVKSDPDFFFVSADRESDETGAGKFRDSFLANPAIQNMRAYHRVIPLEDRYIYASSQNCVYAVKAMANAAYGPLFDMSGEKQIKGY
jgi:iron complex transport system substrate-binding protein